MPLPKLFMNQRVKALWIQALTSGKFKKAVGQLCKGDAHCSLGVLCEVYKEDNNDGGRFIRGGLHFITDDDCHNFSDHLPDVVKDWAGLVGPNVLKHFSYLNDNGVAFPEIARLIEEASSPSYIS